MLYCNTATVAATRRWAGRWASGWGCWARRQTLGRGRASAQGGRRRARAGVRAQAGAGRSAGGRRAGARERAGCASWTSFGAGAPGLVFNLVFRLSIFPKSLNEHCSL